MMLSMPRVHYRAAFSDGTSLELIKIIITVVTT